MKKVIIIVVFYFLNMTIHAQCAKPILLASSKTQFLDDKGNVFDTKDMPTKVELNSTNIIVHYGNNDEDVIKGDVKELVCQWEDPYKKGKATFTSILSKTNGEMKEARFLFEAVEGKLYLTVDLSNVPNRMRLLIDEYKDVK